MTPDLEGIWAHPANAQLGLARSEAIQEYANLEQSMADLLAYLADVKPAVAGTIFFSMVNARSRVRVLEQLMTLKHEDSYATFFTSALKLIPPLDQDRNNIVHWHMSIDVYENADGSLGQVVPTLTPPNFWVANERTPALTVADLKTFAARCHWVLSTLNTFTAGLRDPSQQHDAWRDRHQQPLAYPPEIAR